MFFASPIEAIDGTIFVASAFAGHQEGNHISKYDFAWS